MTKEGLVYILLNPSFINYVKIGKTQKTSEERAKQIYKQGKTGVPTEFVVGYDVRVSDCHLVEQLVHKKLERKRVNVDREFFRIPLKEAIKIIEEVIKELENQHKLDFLQISKTEFTTEEWWNELSFVWQQIFRKHLNLIYTPNEIDLVRAIHSIIDNCQDNLLRNKVIKLVSDKKFTLKLKKWYEEIGNEKKLFNSYLPYALSKKEIEQIFKLEKIDCSNTIAVIDLKPLKNLIYLKDINCSNTYISDLSPLNQLNNLEKINLNYTKIDTLIPLIELSKLKIIDCYSTDLTNNEIEIFNLINPDCKVIFDSFLTSENPLKSKKK